MLLAKSTKDLHSLVFLSTRRETKVPQEPRLREWYRKCQLSPSYFSVRQKYGGCVENFANIFCIGVLMFYLVLLILLVWLPCSTKRKLNPPPWDREQ